MVDKRQVERLMKELSNPGMTLEVAALRAGMSENTGRRYVKGAAVKGEREPRQYRTRQDPFEAVWPEIEVLLIGSPGLEAKTIFEMLQAREETSFTPGQLRTLQRRIKAWRIAHGPEKEVMFPQEHRPGERAQIDFTSMKDLEITIGGERFDHLLYHFVLPYSNWEWVRVCFSESFEALTEGYQGAVTALGGVPGVSRTDNLSAATHDLRDGGRDFNESYTQFLGYYGSKPERNTPGRGHENGDVEQSHHRFKRAVDQALLVRGRREFADRASYEEFLGELADAKNRPRQVKLAEERRALGPLPVIALESFRRQMVRVSTASTVHIGGNVYSVPSRLCGERVEARLRAETIEIWYGGTKLLEMERLRGKGQTRVDYRHVIWSLIHKPGAFARYRYREALFPSLVFRAAFDHLDEVLGQRAEVEYVRILHLAASTSQTQVEQVLGELLERGELRDYAQVRDLVRPEPIPVPECGVIEPDLTIYDALTAVGVEA